MLRVKPFDALRPTTELAQRVASVPYDVVNREEAAQLAEDNLHSFLHVIRPDINLPPETDPYDDAVYDTAKANLDKLIADNTLIRDGKPCVYLYRQTMHLDTPKGKRTLSQTGVVACCHIDDYNNDTIKKHEKTRQSKEDDRTRHTLTLNANTGPVFLLHNDEPTIEKLISSHINSTPIYDFTAPDGVQHTLWRVEEYNPFVAAYAKLHAAYVADGHHRSASAARAGAERRAGNPEHTGDEEYNWFLAALFPASQLNILPYNRYVKDLNGRSKDELLNKISAIARVERDPDPEPRETGVFGMYLDNTWYAVTLPPQSIDHNDPINALDYVLLYDRILNPILGIGDIRTDERIDFIGGIRGLSELERRVDKDGGVAFAMHPITIQQLTRVADAGEIMPPKSTWFEPKLRSGLLVHTLD